MSITDYRLIAGWLTSGRTSVAFTGAGISTESGIPDFRSPEGVWAKSQPVYFDDFLRSAEARREYWRQKSESHGQMAAAQPNAAHRALASWESRGLLRGVITQNIDGMHQLAGSQHVLELHGTAREIACLDCGHREDADEMVAEFQRTREVPACAKCGGLMKHATVSFGQQLPTEVIESASAWASECDLMLALGSSLVVHPAAGIPEFAKRHGAHLVIINRDATPLDDVADLVIRASLGEALSGVDAML